MSHVLPVQPQDVLLLVDLLDSTPQETLVLLVKLQPLLVTQLVEPKDSSQVETLVLDAHLEPANVILLLYTPLVPLECT